MRDNNLEWIQRYRERGFTIFWKKESWVFNIMCQPRFWQTTKILSADDIDYRVPSGNGDRPIACHLGSTETCLLPKCILLCRFRKRLYPDYHVKLNFFVCLKWLENTFFPCFRHTGVKCVLVLDRARYHTMATDDSLKLWQPWHKSIMMAAMKRWDAPSKWINANSEGKCKSESPAIGGSTNLSPGVLIWSTKADRQV